MLFNDSKRHSLFSDEHNIYREQVRRFIADEVVPHHPRWEREGVVSREIWLKAGAAGLLCPSLPESMGGPGGDFLHAVVAIEELSRAGTDGPGFFVHSEMIAPYLSTFGTPAQQQRWLPGFVSGEVIGAMAMTEPGAGSDLRGMRTQARRVDGGWALRGSKVFISNGQLANLAVVAAKTDLADKNSVTLFLVDTTSEGFRRGRNLEKIGVHAQDTSELFFDDVFVPDDMVLGGPGQGFKMLMHGLVRERLSIAVSTIAKAEAALEHTVNYTRDRELFGKHLSDFQNTRFRLAEMKTEVMVGRVYVDELMRMYLAGNLDATEAAAAKLWTTEMLGRVTDAGLQLHGGWGYMSEYPIGRFWVAARVERIAGGASEVMKDIISRSMLGGGGR